MIALWMAVGLANATELGDAIRSRRPSRVRAALSAGADPNEDERSTHSFRGGFFGLGRVKTTTIEASPLQLALADALERDTRILKVLLEAGADPEGSKRDRSFLGQAVQDLTERHAFEVIDLLLQHGAKPSTTTQTALAWVEKGEPRRLVQPLLDAGVPADRLICDAKSVPMLELLMEEGAKADASCRRFPPLLRAVFERDVERMAYLVEAGVSLESAGMLGERPVSALHVAADQGWMEGAEWLVEAGAEIDAVVGLYGETPLKMAQAPLWESLVAWGAKREAPYADAAIWKARAVDPEEMGAYLAACAPERGQPDPFGEGEDLLPMVPGWETLLSPEGRSLLRERILAFGLDDFVALSVVPSPAELERALHFKSSVRCVFGSRPTFSDAKRLLGKPVKRSRSGALRTWTYADEVELRGWRSTFHSRVIEADGVCGGGGDTLLGMSRTSVQLALGRPDQTETTRDSYRTGRLTELRVHYVEGRAHSYTVVFR